MLKAESHAELAEATAKVIAASLDGAVSALEKALDTRLHGVHASAWASCLLL